MNELRPLDVLAIDDDAEDAELLRRHLEGIPELDVSFTHRSDPATITSDLTRSNVDVVFLDYRLGAENGLEVLDRVRACGFLGAVIVLTGHGDENLAAQLMRAGADDYVTKADLDPERLRRAIRNGQAQHAQRLVSTQNRELVEELSSAKRSLEERNRRLAELYRTAHQFVDDVSHEFRTPLSVVKDFASLMRDGVAGDVNDEQREYLTIIVNRVDDLVMMVGDMLDVSKIEAGRLGVHRRPATVAEVVERTTSTIQRRAAASSVRLDLEIPDDLPVVYCDAEKIGRVLVNLVVNAIKFSQDGDGVVRVWARRDADANEVVVGVSDNGSGIPEESLERIFERFRQVGVGVESSIEGFGLGLDISRQLVQLNMGEMHVESTEGEGATFSFSIPLAEPEALIERYLRTEWLSREAASFISLVSVVADTRGDASSEHVRAYLQSIIRHTDLLLGDDGCFLVVVAMNDRDARAVVGRLEKGRDAWDAKSPEEPLPHLRIRSLGTWRVGTRNEDLTRCFRTLWDGRRVSSAIAGAQVGAVEDDPSLERS